MWHPGGYGGIDLASCVTVPGSTHALAFDFRGINNKTSNLQVKKHFQNITFFLKVCVS